MNAASIRDILSRHGLRCTLQRELVYSALSESHIHPTAEELHAEVNRRGVQTPVSLATIYNTLEALTEHGLARRIAPTCGGSGAAFRYDADCTSHSHVVMADGSIRDLPHDLSERIRAAIPRPLVEEVEQRMGMKVRRFGVEFVE